MTSPILRLFTATVTALMLSVMPSSSDAASKDWSKRTVRTFVEAPVPDDISGKAVDIIQMRDSFFAQNPSANTMGIIKSRGQGFFFNRDGSVEHRVYGTKLNKYKTQITSNDGRTVCLAALSYWAGGCMLINEVSDSKMNMKLNWTFKTGPKINFKVRKIISE